MPKPQQPELRRSERGATDTDSAKAKVEGAPKRKGNTGPVPPGNQPGWMDRGSGGSKKSG